MPEKIMSYEDREKMKEEAWSILSDEDAILNKKAYALLWLTEAHYWHAREALETLPKALQRRVHGKRYSRGYLLDIDVYTRHWLHANSSKFAPALIAAFTDLYGYEPEHSRFLPKDCSIYQIPQST